MSSSAPSGLEHGIVPTQGVALGYGSERPFGAPPTTLSAPTTLPVPRVAVSIRAATLADVPFMDSLQKVHSRQVGYFPFKALEGKIALGHVLVAEVMSDECGVMSDQNPSASDPALITHHSPLTTSVGYCISTDRYLKRDELGVVYQLCVVPGERRRLVGAALLKSVFERSAYGCRLYCCWCAQDIEANRFWESMGFVPIAFRGGGQTKQPGGRVHIFWQKRIRDGDTVTPWWFPSKTDAGAMREDRLVLPIPPQLHWSEPMPMLRPQETTALVVASPRPARLSRKDIAAANAAAGPQTPTKRPGAGVQFGPPAINAGHPKEKPAPAPREKQVCDPTLIAAARELRDRWLEEVNADPTLLIPRARYHLARGMALPSIPSTPATPINPRPVPLLPAA